MTGLPRVAHLNAADLNGDGRPDLLACLFGYLTGRFSWFEKLPNGGFKEHVLLKQPGAVKSEVYDFNKDGLPDIAVLITQELETLQILINKGKGEFKTEQIFRKEPSFGHTYFELADFNKDGEMDLMVVNGDNGEYPSPLKKSHGVRIYQNQKNLRFEEVFFFHQNGAYKAVARDFDLDGDLDIASVAFFPDYENNPRESFVFLENLGDLKFVSSTFRECIIGRWLTLDAGDLDGDGDDDIALASMTQIPVVTPDFLTNIWHKSGPSMVILKNSTRP
jgi:hypothetical protein